MRVRPSRPGREQVAVFAWMTGESTNLGDSVLRRPYVAALRDIGPLDLWINRGTPDFLTGLGLSHEDRLSRGFLSWYLRLISTALRRRTLLALNAGEFRAHASRVGLLTALLLAAQVVRLRGGASVWVGASIRESSHKLLRLPTLWAGRSIDYLQWREPGSLRTCATRAVGPDWGFLPGTSVEDWPTDRRDRCAFVLRGDRPVPSPEWFDWARALCDTHGLSPTVIVQVRQDAHRANFVATELCCDVIEWTEVATHAEHEDRVRRVYRRSAIVVGDRLHGLVLGATEGAVPIGWVESSRGKIRAHFDALGMTYVGKFEGAPAADLPAIDPPETATRSVDLKRVISRARFDLRELQVALGTLGSPVNSSDLSGLRRAQRARARSLAVVNASE